MSAIENVKKGVVVGIEYVLKVDGEVVDQTEGKALEYLQGYDNIISGLEKELEGLKKGDNKKVKVAPIDAYGEFDETQIVQIPRSEFPEDVPFVPGLDVEMTSVDGDTLIGTIEEIHKDTVQINFNHPLAGQTLIFDVTIASLRKATEEELAHGHVHQSHDHH